MTGAEFDDAMRTLSTRHQYSETSGRRTVAHNRAVGGDSNSRHLLGLARDCVFDNASAKAAFINDARRMGLVAVDEGDCIHVQSP